MTTSVQNNVKPIVVNLKGRTTIYQHARGIGMTNDKNANLNPLFYSSQIRKLYPYIKKKMKEKEEYMTFRNEIGRNTTYRSSMSQLNINNRYNNFNDFNNYRTNISKLNLNNNYNYNNLFNTNSYPNRNSVDYIRSLNNYNINNDYNISNDINISNGYNIHNDYTMDNDYNIFNNRNDINEQNGIFTEIGRCHSCAVDNNRDSVGYIREIYNTNYFY